MTAIDGIVRHMTATEEIEEWIARYGSERDALNVALSRLRAEHRAAFERGARAMQKAIIEAEDGAMLDGKYIVPSSLPEDVPLPEYQP